MAGTRLKVMFEADAKERQRQHKKTAPGRKSLSANLRGVNAKAATTAAAMVNVSARSVESASKVLVTDEREVIRYLAHFGEPTNVPARASSRGPPYWKSTVLRRKALDEVAF